MSRIGKKPIVLDGAELRLNGRTVSVKGPKGELSLDLVDEVEFAETPDGWAVAPKDPEDKRHLGMWGMQRTMIQNMVEGVTKGYTRKLELVGVGYRAQMKGSALELSLGLSHPVVYDPPKGVSLEVPQDSRGTQIVINGTDKQAVGQVAAEIRRWRPPEPYKGKGVKFAGEQVRRKEGKKK